MPAHPDYQFSFFDFAGTFGSEQWDCLSQIRALLDLRRIEDVVIGRLMPGYARAIGAASNQILLSLPTAKKIASKRVYDDTLRSGKRSIPELLPQIVARGECRQIEPRRLIFLWSSRLNIRKPYCAIVKATRDGQQVFVVSAYRIDLSDIPAKLKRSTPVPRR